MPIPISPKTEPDVVRTLREYRKALDALEIDMMQSMGKQWLVIEKSLQSDIMALALEMDRRKLAGETITQQMVWKVERYQILKAQMDDQIKRFNPQAAQIISDYQTSYATLGITSSNDAIASVFRSGGQLGSWNRINTGAVETIIGFASDGSPLGNLLRNDFPDAYNGLTDALVNGIARGLGPAQTARDMADGMGLGLDRALLIARTETAKTYRAASTQQYRESGVVTGFRRLVKKETACLACLMLDGEYFDVQQELSDHPNGRCLLICSVKGAKDATWQTGEQYFKTLSPEEQRDRMGPERYKLWKSGDITLQDLAGKSHSDVWGDAPKVPSILELTGTAYNSGKQDIIVKQISNEINAEEIKSVIEKEQDNYNYFGLRSMTKNPVTDEFETVSIGDIVKRSYEWNDDAEISEWVKLNGTSAIAIDRDENTSKIEKIIDIVKSYDDRNQIVLLGSQDMEYGNDSKEIIMRSATVILEYATRN